MIKIYNDFMVRVRIGSLEYDDDELIFPSLSPTPLFFPTLPSAFVLDFLYQ